MEGTMATIMLFAGDFAPRYWAFCTGQLLPINQNQALFALLGTVYGGNGTTTFALPDFQGRTPIGVGQGPGLSNHGLGDKSGNANIVLNQNNLPVHVHPASATLTATSAAPNSDEAPGSILAGASIYAAGAANSSIGVSTLPTGPAGQSQPVNIHQPYLGLSFVICMQGVFPSHS